MRSRTFAVSSILVLLACPRLHAATLGDEVEASLQVVAVSGREEPAAEFILGRLAGLPASRDALGNVVLTVGSGEPRRLVACALGEPGFVVSAIREDGYLRVVPAGDGLTGALWTQSHEGQAVAVGGSQGWRPFALLAGSETGSGNSTYWLA
jgi:putative aminopeptidase